MSISLFLFILYRLEIYFKVQIQTNGKEHVDIAKPKPSRRLLKMYNNNKLSFIKLCGKKKNNSVPASKQRKNKHPRNTKTKHAKILQRNRCINIEEKNTSKPVIPNNLQKKTMPDFV